MSETQAKRARAQYKQSKRKDKAERKKLRREQAIAKPTPEVVDLHDLIGPDVDAPGARPRP